MHARWRTGAATLAGTLAGTILIRATAPTEGTAVVVTVAASVVALSLIRRWLQRLGDRLTDVTAERRQLAEQLAQSQAADLAVIAYRERLREDSAATERAADERAERAEAEAQQRIAGIAAALRREYEEKRARELADSYVLGALNERNGIHVQGAPVTGELILLSEHRRPSQDPSIRGVTST